jgi:hypothetical protein
MADQEVLYRTHFQFFVEQIKVVREHWTMMAKISLG